MTELEKVIQMHEQEVASGYTCKDKDNKYARTFDEHMDDWKWYNTRKNPGDYCTIYFDWIFVQALGVDRARKVLNRPLNSCGAGVRYSREYLKSIGRVGDTPKVGCAVYFGSLPYPHHIGFVYKVTEKMIYTYEGNCYVSKGVSGVKAKQYSRDYSDILDYGYPVYADEPEPDPKELDGYKVGNTYVVVCLDELMVRNGPGTAFGKTGVLHHGDRVSCIGLSHDSAGNTWLKHDSGWSCGLYEGTRYIDEPEKNGWVKSDGKWYYYDAGKMLKSEWVEYKGNRYFLGPDGVMVTGWNVVDSQKYYFYPDGKMARSEWIEGQFLGMDGTQTYHHRAKWHQNAKGWWYEDDSGWYPAGRSVLIDRIEYEFDKAGYLIEG